MSEKRRSGIVVGVIVLVMLFLAPTATFGGVLISDVTRTGSSSAPPVIHTPFGESAWCYVDRTHLYSDLPGELPDLVGAEYVVTADNDRNVDDVAMAVTLASNAKVYLILDNRLGGAGADEGVDPILNAEMAWVAGLGFSDTGYDVGVDEGGNGSIDRYCSIFAADLAAGTHTFGEQHDGMIFRGMYAIVAVAGATTAIDVTVDISPGTVNMRGRAPWLICAISVEGGDVADIDVDSIRLNGELGACRSAIDDSGETLTVKFSMADFKASLDLGEAEESTVELVVTGQLNSGESFEETDTITVRNKRSRGRGHRRGGRRRRGRRH